MPFRLFATDLDGTLLGNPAAAWRFSDSWLVLPPHQRPLLVYNTGRTVADTQALVAARQLPAPDFIIGSVGTDLHGLRSDCGAEFRAQFADAWCGERIDEIVRALPGVSRQPAPLGERFKSSWFWIRARRADIEALEQQLAAAGLDATVIYSCRYFLDIVPRRGGKGQALSWLCRRLDIPFERVLVAGDSGNDTAMFQLPGVSGIVVENALPELLAATVNERTYVARQPMADGVLEGLTHFGVFPQSVMSATPWR